MPTPKTKPKKKVSKVVRVKAWAVVENNEFGLLHLSVTRTGPLPYAVYRYRRDGGRPNSIKKTVRCTISYVLPAPKQKRK